jgi:flavorubredoxin
MLDEISREKISYEPVELGDGVFWVGFYDKSSGLHSNPYLIIDRGEAVLLDGGSRPGFPIVMMKILKTGLDINNINALIYQHSDPDLCGSIPHLENMIENKDLKIVSSHDNLVTIKHYGGKSKTISLDQIDYVYRFKSGRELRFYNTPYAHCAGNFITFDTRSEILFSSTLFGTYAKEWRLFFSFEDECLNCSNGGGCCRDKELCPVYELKTFHKNIMPSERALRYAMEVVSKIPFKTIAPLHGSIVEDFPSIVKLVKLLSCLNNVGIDRYVKGLPYDEIGNIDSILNRFEG